MRPTPILPPPLAPREEAAAAQLAAGPARLRFCLRAWCCSWRPPASPASSCGRPRATCRTTSSLAKYEPPVMTRIHAARRQPDGRVRARAAHLRADQRDPQAGDRSLPVGRGQALLRARRPRLHRHRPRARQERAELRQEARPRAPPPSPSRWPRTSCCRSEQKLDRKLKEAILAIRIERTYSKDKILELYLNEIYLGMGSYGVAAAGAQLFRQGAERSSPSRRPPISRPCPRRPTTTIPSAGPRRPPSGATGSSTRWPTNGYITAEQARAAKAKPLKVNIRPFGTQIYAADYFAEEVRRTLVSDVRRGRALRPRRARRRRRRPRQRRPVGAHHARSQAAAASARKALIDGLVAFDREQGWRGPVQERIDIAGDWGAALTGIEIPTDLAPWRLGVVLRGAAHQGRRRPAPAAPGRRQASCAEREAVEIPFDEVKWAKLARPAAPKAVTDVLSRRRRDLGGAQGPGPADGRRGR